MRISGQVPAIMLVLFGCRIACLCWPSSRTSDITHCKLHCKLLQPIRQHDLSSAPAATVATGLMPISLPNGAEMTAAAGAALGKVGHVTLHNACAAAFTLGNGFSYVAYSSCVYCRPVATVASHNHT
jgi:hypothetical protein